MTVDVRRQHLVEWLQSVLGTDDFSCEPASSDASFRRYFRVVFNNQSFVVMDAPPAQEDCEPFIAIAILLREQGINAPKIFHQSLDDGFLVLSDLGCDSYLDGLSESTADSRYSDAVNALHKMHQLDTTKLDIPNYDSALLQQEMGLFDEWFLSKLLGVELSSDETAQLARMKTLLMQSATEQPQVFVHRDYHSRNLMLAVPNNPGVIDFQDAVVGPITYDLASLYRDCYIDWPDEKVYRWLDGFLAQRKDLGCVDTFNKATFYQWFDWMGVQRHMKAMGIFSRLLLRDGKPGYLNDIPRTLGYVLSVCRRYDALMPLVQLLETHQVVASFKQKLAEHNDQ